MPKNPHENRLILLYCLHLAAYAVLWLTLSWYIVVVAILACMISGLALSFTYKEALAWERKDSAHKAMDKISEQTRRIVSGEITEAEVEIEGSLWRSALIQVPIGPTQEAESDLFALPLPKTKTNTWN